MGGLSGCWVTSNMYGDMSSPLCVCVCVCACVCACVSMCVSVCVSVGCRSACSYSCTVKVRYTGMAIKTVDMLCH